MTKQGTATTAAIKKARDLHAKGQPGQAENVYRMILLQDPDNEVALQDLGLILHQRGDTDEPQQLFKRLLALNPKNANATIALALVTMNKGERAEALALAEKARKLSPPPKGLSRLGVFYREAGLQDKALECLTAALRAAPDDVPSYFGLSQMGKLKINSPEFGNLLRIEKKSSALPLRDRVTLEFTLGRTYSEADDAEKAFAHYTKGNSLRKSGYPFAAGEFDEYIGSIIRLFDEKTVKSFEGANTSDRPVFIVGLPRSGSTLVDQILCSHPAVRGIGESSILPDSIPENLLQGTLTQRTLDDIGAKYLAATAPHAGGAKRLTDKMLFNYYWIGLIRLALPNAKIIHCTRDPVDMCFSIWQTMFSEGVVQWGYDFNDIGRYYKGYKRLMAHWEKLFPHDIYNASYEALAAQQEPATRKLLEFCGLPWDDRCLKFFETERRVKTASTDQVRLPIYTSSIQKWRKYEKYLAPLLAALA